MDSSPPGSYDSSDSTTIPLTAPLSVLGLVMNRLAESLRAAHNDIGENRARIRRERGRLDSLIQVSSTTHRGVRERLRNLETAQPEVLERLENLEETADDTTNYEVIQRLEHLEDTTDTLRIQVEQTEDSIIDIVRINLTRDNAIERLENENKEQYRRISNLEVDNGRLERERLTSDERIAELEEGNRRQGREISASNVRVAELEKRLATSDTRTARLEEKMDIIMKATSNTKVKPSSIENLLEDDPLIRLIAILLCSWVIIVIIKYS